MIHSSTIEISRSALKANLNFLGNLLGDGCRLSSVIKGNAYGHGLATYSKLAEELGIRHFSVFSAEEAEICRALLKNESEIVIMGMIDHSDLEWAVFHDVQFFVFDHSRLEEALKKAKSMGKKARIHLEVDTGLNRTGFTKKELVEVVALLEKYQDCVELQGLCTHLAGAESIANQVRIKSQMKKFKNFERWLANRNLNPSIKHMACSAAAISYPSSRLDLARIGIMQYGFWPSKETYISYLNKNKMTGDPLKQLMSWKSRIMSLHRVQSGEFVGYGTSYLAENDMLIGIVPVGYSQGYSRSLSNQGRVLVNGQRISVIGLVNMNMLILDLSHVEQVEIGDEVILIGRQGDLSVSVSAFTEFSNQLNYEMLTRLPEGIPRNIVD